MVEIKLQRALWYFDPSVPLGPSGGFGAVFGGQSKDGDQVAIKQLKVGAEEAGHRELAVADFLVDKRLPHIIPVFDAGLDCESDRYFIVMAKAEYSLQDTLTAEALSETASVEVLCDVVAGLLEVEELVHRDLKPGNILRHEKAWKIADFGIAKFVEETTSLRTLRGCLTPAFAAPEQWRFESATHVTDVYALGCVAFCLVAGHPPFQGDDLQHSHLREEPPRLAASPRLQQLVSLCLRKSPGSRPSLEAVRKQLSAINSEPARLPSVAVAGAAVATAQAAEEAELQQRRNTEARRKELARDGQAILRLIVDQLFSAIEADASVAKPSSDGKEIAFGSGTLRIEIAFPYLNAGEFARWGKDIVCGALITVSQSSGSYLRRSANLWYVDMDGSYRWWEYAYFGAFGRADCCDHEPFGVKYGESLRDADLAAAPGLHSVSVANRPEPVDGEKTAEFITRWAERLAMPCSIRPRFRRTEGRASSPSLRSSRNQEHKRCRIFFYQGTFLLF